MSSDRRRPDARPPRPEPIELDEDDNGDARTGADRAGRRRTAVAASYGRVKWAMLLIGFGCVAVTFGRMTAVQAGGMAGFACFFAAVARVMQAEQHRTR